MDELLAILFFVFLLFILPWILLVRSRRLRKKVEEEFALKFAELTSRVFSIEEALTKLRSGPEVVSPRATEVSSAPSAEEKSSATIPLRKPQPPQSASLPVPKAVDAMPRPAAPLVASEVVANIPPATEHKLPVETFFHPPEPKEPSLFERMKGGFDLEEVLGTNWLNKIGIVILVLGIAFFLAYQLKELGPAGKDVVGFLLSAVLLGGGVFLERKPRYSILARAGIGGGWGLAFFTAYAMGHVEAARIFQSQLPDLLLMGIVASAMVAHSLRYRSQVVTGLAFLLAFSTVSISHVTVYSLAAGAVLSLALVVIVLRMRWFELEIFGIVAAYLNHFWWLWHIIEPMHGRKHHFPEFFPSIGILLLYWLIYRISYVIRSVGDRHQERLATTAALLNSFGLLSLMKYQSVHPEWAFWALLALGSGELGMAFIAARRRRVAFQVLASIGITLLFAAIPFRYSGMNVSVLWVAASQVLLFLGIVTDESLFRRLSFVGITASTIQMLSIDGARILGVRMDGAVPGRNIQLGIAFVVSAFVFYVDAEYVKVRWRSLFVDSDIRVLRLVSYMGMVLGAAGLWIAFPGVETAPAWAIAALVFGIASSRVDTPDLKIQADFLTAIAFLRAVFFNLDIATLPGHISKRLITIGICALAMYVGSRSRPAYALAERFHIPDIYSWLASTLVGTLIWYELHSVSIATAWVLFGLVLVEVGLRKTSVHLRAQGYLALLFGVVRVFIANLAADGDPGLLSPRIYSIIPIVVVLFYLYERLHRDATETSFECRFKISELCAWAALACFAGLVRYELPVDWVVVGWAVLVPLLFAIAWRTGRTLFLQQAVLLTWFTVFRGAMHNIFERTLAPAPFWYSRWICLGSACALLFASLPLAYRLIGLQPETKSESRFKRLVNACLRRPEQTAFFAGFGLVIALLAAEMSKGMLTISWSVFGVVTFLFALWIGERSFRIAGLVLLLLGVAKIAVVDVWSLGPRDRYLTFICMGTALLLVSFLYTRFREAIKQYL